MNRLNLQATVRIALLAAALIVLRAGPAQAQGTFKVGDKVEAYNVDWYKATVIEIGTGSMDGYLRVHFDDFSSASDQYISLRNIRPRPGTSSSTSRSTSSTASASVGDGPRPGLYLIRSYANPTLPVPVGQFQLFANGTYRAMANGGRPIGSGTYSFDGNARVVRFVSGPYRDAGWLGTFTVEREGRTHKIRLNGATVATNSTD